MQALQGLRHAIQPAWLPWAIKRGYSACRMDALQVAACWAAVATNLRQPCERYTFAALQHARTLAVVHACLPVAGFLAVPALWGHQQCLYHTAAIYPVTVLACLGTLL